jgi:hypothetical protein
VKGRKRHLLVDVFGLVWGCFVSAANVADIKAAPVVFVLALENTARFVKILADQSYKGALSVWLQRAFDCTLELTEKLGQGFVGRAVALGGGAHVCLAGKCAALVSQL